MLQLAGFRPCKDKNPQAEARATKTNQGLFLDRIHVARSRIQ